MTFFLAKIGFIFTFLDVIIRNNCLKYSNLLLKILQKFIFQKNRCRKHYYRAILPLSLLGVLLSYCLGILQLKHKQSRGYLPHYEYEYCCNNVQYVFESLSYYFACRDIKNNYKYVQSTNFDSPQDLCNICKFFQIFDGF